MFKVKKIISVILCTLLVANMSIIAPIAKNNSKISLSKTKVTLNVNNSFHISSKKKAKVIVNIASDNSDKAIIVKSNSKIIKITKVNNYDYKIKALKKGVATIAIKAKNNKSSMKLKVKINNKKKPVGVIELNENNFEKEVLKSKNKVIVDFSTKWCYYCQLLEPIFTEAALKTSKYKFCHIDVDEQASLADEYGISGVPTMLIYEKGRVIRTEGYVNGLTADNIIKWLEGK